MPLTADRPKCLVSLAGKPLLTRLIEVLRDEGVCQITIVAGYQHDQIANVARDCKIVLNPDYATTNMVTTLFCADSLFIRTSDDLLISYSDIVYEPRVAKAIITCDAPVAVAVNTAWRRLWELRMADPLSDAETMKIDAEGNIRELGKAARSFDEIQGQFTGLIKVRADHVAKLRTVYDAMDRGGIYDGQPFPKLYTTSFLQHLINLGWQVQAVPVEGGWLEVDTIDDLNLYRRMASEGTLSTLYCIGTE